MAMRTATALITIITTTITARLAAIGADQLACRRITSR